jgi:predicted transcriptional regulator
VRASISSPLDLHKRLEEIAKQKKVSLAWAVRDAAERYVAEETIRAPHSQTDAPRRQISR